MIPKPVSVGALFLAPLFFSSNLLFGKTVLPYVEPWTLAFIRWMLVGLILLPFVSGMLSQYRRDIRELFTLFGFMGFLGMWICGALVYQALTLTTATNATLIYLSSPVMILLIEALWRGRRISKRERFGIFFATAGVLSILVKGNVDNLLSLKFNAGDVLMIFAAAAWAIYSVVLKTDRLVRLPNIMLLCIFSLAGALTLLPYAAIEMLLIAPPPSGANTWFSIAGIVLSSSLLAFLAYQHSVRFAGPAITGIFMYLLPGYGVGLAVLVLGEVFEWYHALGICTILGGVVLATFPLEILRSKLNPTFERIYGTWSRNREA